jgi:hypothetical protein
MLRKRLIPVFAALIVACSVVAVSPRGVAASLGCHEGGYTETQRSNTYQTPTAGNYTSVTMRVRWEYVYDCSWNIIAVNIDWRRVTLTIKGPDMWLGYGRDLISLHVISKYNPIDTAYPNYSPCYQANCTFGPWTDYGDVYLFYSPSDGFNEQYSPHTRMSCQRCTPVGVDSMAADYWFIHNKSDLFIVTA